MIDIMKFMDDLKEIKLMVEDQQPRYIIVDTIDDKIRGYQKEVDEFEKWAEEESQKDMAMPFPEGVR